MYRPGQKVIANRGLKAAKFGNGCESCCFGRRTGQTPIDFGRETYWSVAQVFRQAWSDRRKSAGGLAVQPSVVAPLLALLLLPWLTSIAGAWQFPQTLMNGGFEEWLDDQKPTAWRFHQTDGGKLSVEGDAAFAGERSAVIDARNVTNSASFSNVMQVIDATPYRGKKVRFRGAVRTADLQGQSRAQLWMRVDRPAREGQEMNIAAFDNMDDRPIRSGEWQHYEIVLPVDPQAVQIACGMFLMGTGRAYFDDVSLEAVASDVSTTAPAAESAAAAPSNEQPTRGDSDFQIPKRVQEAFLAADQAPQQPFFTHWLWLAALAIGLSLYAMTGPLPGSPGADSVEEKPSWQLRRFALRFAVIYWVLYSGSISLTLFVPAIGQHLHAGYESIMSRLVHALARGLFGIEGELVPPNGSGDTTFNYLQVLLYFLISLLGASIWTIAMRRPGNDAGMRDLLWSLLRYSLAFAMVTYGLAKISFTDEGNQFPRIGQWQLDKTWGSSSPMNVLWAFMGSSRAYTIFAGLGEVVGGVLIVFRRTALLGALVIFGVMLNVMMLNYCYDVPVKLYSTHLVVMSLMVLMPDAGRLLNLFVFNRPTPQRNLAGLWQGRWKSWFRFIIKTLVIGGFMVLPIAAHVYRLPGQWQAHCESLLTKPKTNDILTNRGFRWINEVPFNR